MNILIFLVILGASFANILVLFFLLMVRRGKRGYFGIRLYTFNLALFALIQIVNKFLKKFVKNCFPVGSLLDRPG